MLSGSLHRTCGLPPAFFLLPLCCWLVLELCPSGGVPCSCLSWGLTSCRPCPLFLACVVNMPVWEGGMNTPNCEMASRIFGLSLCALCHLSVLFALTSCLSWVPPCRGICSWQSFPNQGNNTTIGRGKTCPHSGGWQGPAKNAEERPQKSKDEGERANHAEAGKKRQQEIF